VQECLTNVHRHSGSSRAAIRLTHQNQHLCVEVSDDGRGMSGERQGPFDAKPQPGVGIRGMRERLRKLNGTLEISSKGRGTQVTAKIPLPGPTASIRQGAA
jgi:signal transduction histidine kinase